MKKLRGDLQSVVKSLKALTSKTESIAKQLGRIEKAQVAKKPKARAKPKRAVARKAPKGTATDAVLRIVQNSRKGVDTPALKKKTGFEGRKIRDILYRLKKEGKIKSAGKGLYAKA